MRIAQLLFDRMFSTVLALLVDIVVAACKWLYSVNQKNVTSEVFRIFSPTAENF